MKIKQIAMISILAGVLGATIITAKQTGDFIKSQKQIAEQVIRFHVRANSDNEADQSEKMQVKNEVVNYLQPLMQEAKNVEEGREILNTHEEEIQKVAVETLKQIKENQRKNMVENAEQIGKYTENQRKEITWKQEINQIEEEEVPVPEVKVYLTREQFPTKSYGEFVFPAGKYEALRVDIGEAKGHNWWCVMYPSLCFLDETHGVVPVESQQKLKQVLTEEDYQNLRPQYKLKIVELIKKYF